MYEDVPQEVIYTSPSKTNTYYYSDVRGTDKRSKIDAMDAEFDSLQASLAQVRAKKNTDFYDDHNNNYYKGQLKRDQTRTSVKLIQDRNLAHL